MKHVLGGPSQPDIQIRLYKQGMKVHSLTPFFGPLLLMPSLALACDALPATLVAKGAYRPGVSCRAATSEMLVVTYIGTCLASSKYILTAYK